MIRIDGDRLLADLDRLRQFGATGNGVVRTCYSDVDIESRHWLTGRMREAGLEAEIDGIGNVIGRSPGPGRAVLIGSHTDTQPRGGWLDGAMGVMYGLEVARALGENHATRDLAVDVASWADEEGSYSGFIGIRSFCGLATEADIDAAANDAGEPLRVALTRGGFAGRPRARLDPLRQCCYLEAHIEQGGYLEAGGKRIGVVTDIVGMRDYRIVLHGRQNHAGTTPMHLRRDAGAACIALAHRLQTEFAGIAGERSVWTVGDMRFDPGAASIVPGGAEMAFQFRDPDDARMRRMHRRLYELVAEADGGHGVSVRVLEGRDHVDPVAMDADLQQHLARAAAEHAADAWMHMPSGAGHDAQVIARCIPSAMLFVPSIGGVSHDFAEDTGRDDIVLGCQVLASAVVSVLRG